jgi:hypothetical protein
MALIVEDGTGLANAESYISVVDATAYHAARGNADWAALASDTVREQLLRKATDYMQQEYRTRWKGVRVLSTQALDWPRAYVVRDDISYTNGQGYVLIDGFYYYPSDEVPIEVARACAELALRASVATLAPDLGQKVVREKIDVIEVEYDKYAAPYTTYRAVDGMLEPFFIAGSSGVNRKVVRA